MLLFPYTLWKCMLNYSMLVLIFLVVIISIFNLGVGICLESAAIKHLKTCQRVPYELLIVIIMLCREIIALVGLYLFMSMKVI